MHVSKFVCQRQTCASNSSKAVTERLGVKTGTSVANKDALVFRNNLLLTMQVIV